MLEWYQRIPEMINPEMMRVGFFVINWYAATYFVALCFGMVLLRKKTKEWLSLEVYIDVVFAVVLGILIGARLGYVVLYNFAFYAEHPWSILLPFDEVTGQFIGIAGMSYFGGCIGAGIGLWLSMHQNKAQNKSVSVWRLADTLVSVVPLGYFIGRVGNFLNGELYGRVTTGWYGMYFPEAPDDGALLRHPSQLYEAFFEGIVLWFLLQWIRAKSLPDGNLLAMYVFLYGAFRFVLEFAREPDPQLSLWFNLLSLGQILASLWCIIGLVALSVLTVKNKKAWSST
jgi:phosphatidylglycerol:prolipoprotein diacylglycerol transferase